MATAVTRGLFSARGCQEVPVLPPASTTSPLRPMAGAAPQRGNSRLEFVSTARQAPTPLPCPRGAGRARADPPGVGTCPHLAVTWGSNTWPGREAPCGSCNPRDPCVNPWPQLSRHWRNKPSGVVLLALSQNCPQHQRGWHCWHQSLPAPALDLAGAHSDGGGFWSSPSWEAAGKAVPKARLVLG